MGEKLLYRTHLSVAQLFLHVPVGAIRRLVRRVGARLRRAYRLERIRGESADAAAVPASPASPGQTSRGEQRLKVRAGAAAAARRRLSLLMERRD